MFDELNRPLKVGLAFEAVHLRVTTVCNSVTHRTFITDFLAGRQGAFIRRHQVPVNRISGLRPHS